MTALLGIDLGTSSAKALIVDEAGKTLGNGWASYPLRQPQPGWAEQDADEWWRAAIAAVRMAHIHAGSPPISAIGLSGQMHGTVLLDESGGVLRPAVIWADTRSGTEVAEITAKIGLERLTEIAGSAVAAGFQAATIAWIQRHEPEVWARTAKALLPKDYLRWRLTGAFVTEPSDASSTLLLDVSRQEWSDDLLGALPQPLSGALLPELMPSTSISGTLMGDAAKAFSLSEDISVVGGGGDAPLAALGAGVFRPDQLALTISSGSQVISPTERLLPDVEGRIHAWCSALAGWPGATGYYQMGATMASGLALRWLAEKVFGLRHRKPEATLSKWASEATAGAGGLIFVPYLAGERTPHMDPLARGMFLGLTASHGREYLARAVMEGTIFAAYDAFEVLRSLGASPSTLVLCGGGAQSKVWRQIVADVFEMPVRPLLTVEQSALGAAMLAGAGIGLLDPLVEAQNWPTYDEPVMPEPASVEVYRRLLPIYRSAYRNHAADFAELSELSKA